MYETKWKQFIEKSYKDKHYTDLTAYRITTLYVHIFISITIITYHNIMARKCDIQQNLWNFMVYDSSGNLGVVWLQFSRKLLYIFGVFK
jgi:TctA family transporter